MNSSHRASWMTALSGWMVLFLTACAGGGEPRSTSEKTPTFPLNESSAARERVGAARNLFVLDRIPKPLDLTRIYHRTEGERRSLLPGAAAKAFVRRGDHIEPRFDVATSGDVPVPTPAPTGEVPTTSPAANGTAGPVPMALTPTPPALVASAPSISAASQTSPVDGSQHEKPAIETQLPVAADRAFSVRDSRTDVSISVTLRGAKSAPAEVGQGYVVYSGGYAGADVLHRPHLFGTEEYIAFDLAPPVEAVTYDVTLGSGVRGVRLVANSLEFLDDRGAPRLRMAPPFVAGSDGTGAFASVSVEGCTVDTSEAPPWDRDVTPPSSSHCSVHVDWSRTAISYPAILDPAWSSTSFMAVARAYHASAKVTSGGRTRALVFGGSSFVATTATSELYDELTGSWAQTGNMVAGVREAATLSLPDGRVLCLGGYQMNPEGSIYAGAQTYDPSTGQWSSSGALPIARMNHTATLLGNGRVLVAGGISPPLFPLTVRRDAVIYDPSTQQPTPTGSTRVGHAYHTATLLPSGGVLAAAGLDSSSDPHATVEIYDPATGQWSDTDPLPVNRYGHVASLLLDSRVLVAGGSGAAGTIPATLATYFYDTGLGKWSPGPPTQGSHYAAGATLLLNGANVGKVVLAGGDFALSRVELLSPTAPASWAPIAPLSQGREAHAVIALASGLLMSGGTDGNGVVLSSAELYDPNAAASAGANPIKAPPLDRTVVINTAAQTQFLFTGTNPVQTGVSSGAIDATRAAELHGRVTDRDTGAAISGVTVTVVGHPEWGTTITTSGGGYRLVVNGGTNNVTLDFSLTGYLSGRRQLQIAELTQRSIDEMSLIRRSTAPSTPVSMPVNGQPAGGARRFQAPAVTDSSGSRQLSILFPSNTTANAVAPDNSTSPLSTLTVHATEYTVGASGPQAMPADLPPTSAYTYAVELEADEASRVSFGGAVPVYVDNFLNLPVGAPVPSGYYDRALATWVASDNGRVIKILSVTAGKANLDVDGSGSAASAATLSTIGITDEERTNLASSFSVGKVTWRVPVTHFSLYDFNFGLRPPPGALPGAPGRNNRSNPRSPCADAARSTVECETQVLTEEVPITGTPFHLQYRSDRVLGRKDRYTLDIPITPSTLPGPLAGVIAEITVAGRTFSQSFGPVPNQTMTFTWDGYDAFGRMLQGTQPVFVRLGNIYDVEYAYSPRFGVAGGASSGVESRVQAPLWGSRTYGLGTWDARAEGLGGWNLDVHHVYDPVGKIVELGSGPPIASDTLDSVVSAVAGNGQNGFPVEGTPAVTNKVIGPSDIAFGPDGLPYFTTTNCIMRVLSSGLTETYAGNCSGVGGASGDGGPALSALVTPSHLAFGPDGSLYFSDVINQKVRKIAPTGTHTISTVAGTGTAGFTGDGGLATSARLAVPRGLAVAADGTLFIADSSNGRVRSVGVDGIIQTVAGNKANATSSTGDEGLATNAALVDPSGLAVSKAGELYVGGTDFVRRIGPDGIIHAFAGSATPEDWGDGGPATDADISLVWDLELGRDGSLYIADKGSNSVRRVDKSGTISTAVGINGRFGFNGDLNPATATLLELASTPGIGISPDDVLYLTDDGNVRYRKVKPALPGVGTTDTVIPSRDGSEVYVFNSAGKHLRTLDAFIPTTRPLLEFAYDASTGFLSTVTDVDGNVTSVLRDAAGRLLGLRGPFGQTTTIALDSAGYIASIANPASESTQFVCDADGLLRSKTSPRGFKSTYSYDANGRLQRDADPVEVGGYEDLTFTPADAGWTVDKTTRQGRATHFGLERTSTGDLARVTTPPNHVALARTDGQNGVTTVTLADGTTVETTETADPRWGMLAPVASQTVKTPLGLTRSSTTLRSVVLSDPSNQLSLTAYTETRVVNGKTYTTVFDPATLTFTTTSPVGRKSFHVMNGQARLASSQVDSLLTTQFGYDSRGRLSTIATGSRSTALGYDPTNGYLKTFTNPLSQVTTFIPDLAGRLTKVTYPDTNFAQTGYDLDGNLNALTPPGKPVHAFQFDAVNLLNTYTPPTAPGTGTLSTTYTRDFDRAISRVSRPDAVAVQYAIDSVGRLHSVSWPTGSLVESYDPVTGQLANISGPYGETTSVTHDGSLLKSISLAGPVAGTVTRTYDDDFRLASEKVNSGTAISFGYDEDSLVTSAGSLTLSHDPKTGWVTGATLASIVDTVTFDTFGALATDIAKFNATTLYAMTVTLRDSLNRISQKQETLAGTTNTYDYTYDTRGRLTDVRKNTALTAHYEYDANGNRTLGPIGQVGSVDNQDRLSTYGTKTYAYSAQGDLQSKTDGGQTSSYTYDPLGNLTHVGLSGGTNIDYIADGFGHRVGKKQSGTLVKGWLYRDGSHIAAELDGAGNVVSTFVYGSKRHVPDYLIKAGVNYRLVTDHLGSVRLVVHSTTGAIAQRLDYDEFGVVTSDTSPGFQPFGFAGGHYDPDTKLTRFGVRDYDAVSGRWTRKDPLAFGGGDTNLYAYVGGDPVNRLDPNGGFWWGAAIGGFAGAAYDLVSQLESNGGQLGCVSWGEVGAWAAGGAIIGAGGEFLLGELAGGGGVLRGINNLGGVVSSSENAAGGLVVTAEGPVYGVDFAGHVNAGLLRDGPVDILSGVHGSAAGEITFDAKLLAEDVAMYGHIEGVTVHNFANLSASEVSALLKGSGTTIGAFCNSGICLAPFM